MVHIIHKHSFSFGRGPLIVQNRYTNMVALAKKITCTIRINNYPNLSFVDMWIKQRQILKEGVSIDGQFRTYLRSYVKFIFN